MNYRTFEHEDWQAVVGDEKQKDFYPRVKIKKWSNDVNLSVGLKHSGGTPSKNGNVITYNHSSGSANFYPIGKDSDLDSTKIRLINLGPIDPIQMSSQFEVDKNIFWKQQTILYYNVDRPSMLYYGSYKTKDYILDIDIPECRFSGEMNWNPLYMDPGLEFVEIHFNHDREDVFKIEPTFIQATKDVLGKYINIVDQAGGKLFFDDNGKKVKFFSGGTFETAYMVYINMNTQYNHVYDYYKPGIDNTPNDQYAYGINAVNKDIPKDIILQIIDRYAEICSKTIYKDKYNDKENNLIKRITTYTKQNKWIKNANRDSFPPLKEKIDHDGFEFEIILNEKPSTNKVALSVQSKGLDFYYQDGIPKDINERIPDNVVGSFAVYRKEPISNHSNKAFHIFRPWAVDSNGQKVWCSFDSKWNGDGDLEISIPEDFINNAAYPILIDPTYGYLAAGASSTTYSPTSGTQKVSIMRQSTPGLGVYAPGRPTTIAFYASITSLSTSNPILVNTGLYIQGGARADYSNTVTYSGTGSVGPVWLFYPLTQFQQLSLSVIYDSIVFASITYANASQYATFVIYWDAYYVGSGTAAVFSTPPPATEPALSANANVYSIYFIQAYNGPMLSLGVG